MPAPRTYDYAVVRVVPRVERGEFINAGIILSCATERFLTARVELDEGLLAALAPQLDAEPIRAALDAIPLVCAGGTAAGPIGLLSVRERFHWLVAPRSTSVQTSPVHSGRAGDLEVAMEQLMRRLVRRC